MVLAVVVGAKDGLQPCEVEGGEFSKVKDELSGVCGVDPVECGHHLSYTGEFKVTGDPENQGGG
jgi:hypothetical protein